jgi:hypothetical protein
MSLLLVIEDYSRKNRRKGIRLSRTHVITYYLLLKKGVLAISLTNGEIHSFTSQRRQLNYALCIMNYALSPAPAKLCIVHYELCIINGVS